MKVLYLDRKKFVNMFLLVLAVIMLLTILEINVLEVAQNVMETITKENPIYFVYTDEEKMALTFDAAWGAEHTEHILTILAQNEIKATFFLTDIWLKAYPEMAKQIAIQGHEIAMHSVTHPHFNELTKEQMVQEIEENRKTIMEITGYEGILFRFPFGEYNNLAISTVRELGYYPIQWSIDSLDWQDQATKESICEKVENHMHNGAIILFHNNGTFTAAALEEIIKTAKEKGYQFVSVGELIYQVPEYKTDVQGGQSK